MDNLKLKQCPDKNCFGGTPLYTYKIYCTTCGKLLIESKIMGVCGHEVYIGDNFCGTCGARAEVKSEEEGIDEEHYPTKSNANQPEQD